MAKAGSIIGISPRFAIPGGEIVIECEGLKVESGGFGCFADGIKCRVIAASSERVLAAVPNEVSGSVGVQIESSGGITEPYNITIGELVSGTMHMVANPAVDPGDDSLIITRSGSRGQSIPYTLYRVEDTGYIDELPAEILNPTGIAFDPDGSLYVTNRADGELCRIERGEDVIPFASGLGIATGLAFDADGIAYVGDRTGIIYRVPEFGTIESFAYLEPSVSAYHLAFAANGNLLVSAPGLASHDSIFEIDPNGNVESYVKGFGRPQGLAFDTNGDLYAAACYKGSHGIVRISATTRAVEMFAAGNNVVGLCFTRIGEMIVATSDTVFSFDVGKFGTLLQ